MEIISSTDHHRHFYNDPSIHAWYIYLFVSYSLVYNIYLLIHSFDLLLPSARVVISKLYLKKKKSKPQNVPETNSIFDEFTTAADRLVRFIFYMNIHIHIYHLQCLYNILRVFSLIILYWLCLYSTLFSLYIFSFFTKNFLRCQWILNHSYTTAALPPLNLK